MVLWVYTNVYVGFRIYYSPPLFLIASTFFVGSGLIVIFQSKLPIEVYGMTEFTGFALVAWGFMHETVQFRVNEKEREILDSHSS
ncbi:hypothetical protein HJ107_02920 [Vibrio parahaemolyticus]|uniref:hypothetical protein n=1 Tax=Vibrio parahaemolyticus TaxID=670 RepID=UPI000DF8F296|nr:hypothetical protein [Vibrio parahaemolyticus]EJG1708059.1 hypothetical protein [Vibrio parahaemolyticus]EJG1740569.1 hypothetical protein [Vibrio parahaemolyticus]EJG1780418.1 hypothetical protein [Vibrio parahaemolyticus]MBE4085792.1 hypothetical protein [Vibrio parahaemolyticus]MDF4734681.1 hypothetical protein [Vibrio parahaemolyticus]